MESKVLDEGVLDEGVLEEISAAMDGESPAQQAGTLLGKVASDAKLSEAWYRYHLLGDAMRGQVPDHIDLHMRHKTRESLVAEPTVLAPTKRLASLLKPVAGLAIAASVAALAVIGARQLLQLDSVEPVPGIVQQRPAGVERPPVAVVSWQPQTQAATRLNSYLVNYSEHRSNAAVPATLPYVRIVGRETDDTSQ